MPQWAAKVCVQPIEALAPAATMSIALLGGFKEDLSKRHLGLAGQILQLYGYARLMTGLTIRPIPSP